MRSGLAPGCAPIRLPWRHQQAGRRPAFTLGREGVGVEGRGCASRGAFRAATGACVPPPPPPPPPPPLGLVHLFPCGSCQSCSEFGSQRNLLSQDRGEPDGRALRPALAWEGTPPRAFEGVTKVGFAVPFSFHHFFSWGAGHHIPVASAACFVEAELGPRAVLGQKRDGGPADPALGWRVPSHAIHHPR